jgi:hypothetical protein
MAQWAKNYYPKFTLTWPVCPRPAPAGAPLEAPVTGHNRRVIPATCTTHGGTPGYTNLVVTKHDAEIELDPHVNGSCVIRLEEDGARTLCEALQEWLG